MVESNVRRVGMLAPMDIELQPLVRRLSLVVDGEGIWRGTTVEGLEVLALLTTIGMAPGAAAAQRVLELGVDHVMVVGIAGAVALDMPIATVIAPYGVIDRVRGQTFTPTALGSTPRAGLISCGDDLITDAARLGELSASGVIAVDMETAAVAAVCDDAGCAWSVFRSISDHAGGGLIDDDLFAMTRPDGSADPDALARVLADPAKRAVLERLARDTGAAVEAAAAAAIEACAFLNP